MTKTDEILELVKTEKVNKYNSYLLFSIFMLECLANCLIINNEHKLKDLKEEVIRIYSNIPTTSLADIKKYLKNEGIRLNYNFENNPIVSCYIIDHIFIWKDTKKGYGFWCAYNNIFSNRGIKIIFNKTKYEKLLACCE